MLKLQGIFADVMGVLLIKFSNVSKKRQMAFGSSPFERDNQRTDDDFAERGLFWTNVDGCLFEIMTYEF